MEVPNDPVTVNRECGADAIVECSVITNPFYTESGCRGDEKARRAMILSQETCRERMLPKKAKR